MPGGVEFCMNYEFNLLHHVAVVAKRMRAAAAETAHEGDDNTPSGPKNPLVSMVYIYIFQCHEG